MGRYKEPLSHRWVGLVCLFLLTEPFIQLKLSVFKNLNLIQTNQPKKTKSSCSILVAFVQSISLLISVKMPRTYDVSLSCSSSEQVPIQNYFSALPYPQLSLLNIIFMGEFAFLTILKFLKVTNIGLQDNGATFIL